MSSKQIAVGILLLALGIALGINSKRASTSVQAAQTIQRTYATDVVFVYWPGWAPVKAALNRISAISPEIHTTFSGPTDGDPAKQIEELDTVLEKKPDGLILFASDKQALGPAIDKFATGGVPIVTLFGDVEESKRLTFISADDRGSARRLAGKVAEKIKDKFSAERPAKLLLCTVKVGIASSDERIVGFKEALANVPWIKIVGMVADNNDDAKSVELMSGSLIKNDGLDVILSATPRCAIGATAALKERHSKAGDVLITGWDNDADVLEGILNGWIWASSTPKFDYMTQLAISILDANSRGLLFKPTTGQGLTDRKAFQLPSRIEVEQTFIDRDNVAEFQAWSREGK